MSEKYFANLPTNELLPELEKRINKFNEKIERSGRARLWRKSTDCYFGKHFGESGAASSSIHEFGDDGELKGVKVNHQRNLVRHMLALTTSQKPSYDPRAKNTDVKSLNQAKLAGNIIETYVQEKRIGRSQVTAAELALVVDTGFTYMTWDPSLGEKYSSEPVMREDGTPFLNDQGEPLEKTIAEGDIAFSAKTPWDVIYNLSIKDWSKVSWIVVREFENKFKLAARHPEMAEEILSVSHKDELDKFRFSEIGQGYFRSLGDDEDEEEIIPVYHFYHLRDDACQAGRYTSFIGKDIAIYDGPIQYRRLPVRRITPGSQFNSTLAYTDFYDTLVLQEAVNTLYSIPYTNQQAFAVQKIWLPAGCDITSEQISQGLAILKGGAPGMEPKPIQLTATPQEVFTNIQMIESAMEKTSGVNSVVRGEAPGKSSSGAALGRLQSMAIQYAFNFQRSWSELLEDDGTGLLENLQDFAQTERMIAIAGKHNRYAMQSFKGEDIKDIQRVTVDLGNPLFRTAAGRQDVANDLMNKGLIKSVQEYITFINTGNIDPMFESLEAQNTLIRQENEFLMEGKAVIALMGDKHLLHMQEHLAVLNDPYLRQLAAENDQEAMQMLESTRAHIEQHMNLYQTQMPLWAMINGEQPAPPPPPELMPPNGMPQEQGPSGPPPGSPESMQGPDGQALVPPIPPIGDLPPIPGDEQQSLSQIAQG